MIILKDKNTGLYFNNKLAIGKGQWAKSATNARRYKNKVGAMLSFGNRQPNPAARRGRPDEPAYKYTLPVYIEVIDLSIKPTQPLL